MGSVLLITGALVVSASIAWAAASISVNPSTASPGDAVTISGNVPTDGCPASDAAQLTSTSDLFPPDGFGPQAARDASGNFTTSYAIPASTPAGTYGIGVRCGGGNVGISADLNVVAPAASTTTVKPSTTTTSTSSTTTSSTTTTTAPTTTASSSSAAAHKSSSSALPWILLAILLLLSAIVAAFFVRRRQQAPQPPQPPPV